MDNFIQFCICGTVPSTIGYEKNKSCIREGDKVKVCLVVADGEVPSPVSISLSTANIQGIFTDNQTNPYMSEFPCSIGKFS